MNPLEEESLIDPTERDLVERLERYDDALRTSRLHPAPSPESDIPPSALVRLEEACAAIDMLRQARVLSVTPGRPLIAGYEMLEVLGRGGMGIVYKARDLALNRSVALKLILAGAHAASEDLVRFRSEAEAVARLDHPNIVRIYDVGQQDQDGGAVPYMALELVEGGTLAARLDGTPQPVRASAALSETLARAVDYAHERGIVHRDLKPANILMQIHGEPSVGAAIPKIADFGLAKRLGDQAPRQTATGTVLGTAQYMAPEQAAGRNHLVGPATDIYALGAVLYHLLTGRPPFAGDMPTDILMQVLNEEPLAVRRLRPQVSRDLETICLKCLEKEPGKRYATARALAEDLRGFLDGRPIAARPIAPWGRLWRWARRRPVVASLSAALVLVTLLSIVLVGWQWREAVANAKEATDNAAAEAEARRDADRRAREVESLLLGADIDRAVTFCERGDGTLGLLWLARCLPIAIRLHEADLERVIRANLASWGAHFSRQRGMLQHDDWAWDVAFSPDGRFVLTGARDRKVRLWDALTCELQAPPLEHPWPVWSVAFSPDGRTILSGCGSEDGKHGDARLWDTATRRSLATLPASGRIEYAAFDRSGNWLLTRGPNRAQLWKVPRAGQEVLPPVGLRHPGHVRTALFSPDGRAVLTGGSDGTARLWDTEGQPQGQPMPHPGPVVAAAFRPDGRAFATGIALGNAEGTRAGGAVYLWETDACKSVGAPLSQGGPPNSLAFSPDGRMLLTGGLVVPTNGGKLSGAVRLYDAERLTPLGPVLPHLMPVRVVAFSPDGRTFLTGAEDRHSRQWMTATCLPVGPGGLHNGTVRSVAFSPDGRRFVCGSAGDTPQVQLWEAAQGLAVGPPLYHLSAVHDFSLSTDGKRLAAGCADGMTWIWDSVARQPLRMLKGNQGAVLSANMSPDATQVVSAYDGGAVRLWDAATGQGIGNPLPGPNLFSCARFSPDGKTFATGRYDRGASAQRWQVPDGKHLADLAHPNGVRALAYGPDGRWLLTAGDGGVYRWDTDSGKLLGRPLIQTGVVTAIAVSPDGERVVSAGSGAQTAQMWETVTGRRIGPPLPHQATVHAVAFSRDGRLLLTGSYDKTARVWDAATGKPLTPPLWHRDVVMGVAFLPDGKRFVTAGLDQAVQFWELPEPMSASSERVRADLEFLTGMELDERGAVRPLSTSDWVRRRPLP